MKPWMLLSLIVASGLCFSIAGVLADGALPSPDRFFHTGDGRIHLKSNKSEARFQGRYRIAAGDYDMAAYQAICRVFGAPCTENHVLSLRLIEFIDALEDRFNPGAEITITSGYRSPSYNTHLRNKGRLAAKASLHQYGMAADFKMSGVSSRRIWEHVKKIGFGGAGYYQGETVHIDVGPARSWDQKSSGVGSGISDDNKLIGLVMDYDVYRPGEPMILRFIRMTAFPIGLVTQFSLYRQSGSEQSFMLPLDPDFVINAKEPCPQFENIGEMDNIRWSLPDHLPPGRYRIGARFCNPAWPEMPGEVASPAFVVVGP